MVSKYHIRTVMSIRFLNFYRERRRFLFSPAGVHKRRIFVVVNVIAAHLPFVRYVLEHSQLLCHKLFGQRSRETCAQWSRENGPRRGSFSQLNVISMCIFVCRLVQIEISENESKQISRFAL